MKRPNYYQVHKNKVSKIKRLNLTFKRLTSFSGFDCGNGQSILLVFGNGQILGKPNYK